MIIFFKIINKFFYKILENLIKKIKKFKKMKKNSRKINKNDKAWHAKFKH